MLGFGAPLSEHMGLHIALMNVVAPGMAFILLRFRRWKKASLQAPGSALASVTILQLLLLWAWHAPGVLNYAMTRPEMMNVMHASLFGIAFCFWRQILHAGNRWTAILALLVSAKLYCLLGILLTLSPRVLYAGLPFHQGDMPVDLADQQLAGLLMLTACPLSYILAATIVASGWVRETPTTPVMIRASGAP
jgi:putative membrane protein